MVQISFLDLYNHVILNVISSENKSCTTTQINEKQAKQSDLVNLILESTSLPAGDEHLDEAGWETVQNHRKNQFRNPQDLSFGHSNPYSVLAVLHEPDSPGGTTGVDIGEDKNSGSPKMSLCNSSSQVSRAVSRFRDRGFDCRRRRQVRPRATNRRDDQFLRLITLRKQAVTSSDLQALARNVSIFLLEPFVAIFGDLIYEVGDLVQAQDSPEIIKKLTYNLLENIGIGYCKVGSVYFLQTRPE
ncbi:hypothetical protein J6590_073785 [Homalodisca vitripennis]|nr:hypothetical protein J6590_090476 [Homalodisca vitripennis]KAG8290864.1 hypothetical protein J6590_073785 [Homalodisca vitripennis]